MVAFGTGSPELAVGLDASLRGVDDVALGNVVGSNICNTTLVLGVAALIRPLRVDATVLRLDVPLAAGASLLAVALLVDGGLSRLEGALLAAGIAAYFTLKLRGGRREHGGVRAQLTAGLPESPVRGWSWALLGVGGLGALALGARAFVNGAADLAAALGVSQALIALTVVALGTSLPELATSTVAAARGYGDIAIGNVVGSNAFNALAILGACSLARPLTRGAVGWVDLGLMVTVGCVILPLMRTGSRLDRREGALLLAVYAGYLSWLARSTL